MFSSSIELYDLIYRRMKDYAKEAGEVATLVRGICPGASTVLDVGCGTGEHALHLRTDHGFRVDGVDLEPGFVDLARAKNPDGEFVVADMCHLDLGRTYDVVLCLFGAIGYVRDEDRLRSAIAALARHAAPGGVVIVEPWFAPGALTDGYVSLVTAEDEGVSVCRMGFTEVKDRISRLRMEYLVGTTGGIRHETETHELGLFTRDEMEEAFVAAGLAPDYDDEGPTGRGLYRARRKSGDA